MLVQNLRSTAVYSSVYSSSLYRSYAKKKKHGETQYTYTPYLILVVSADHIRQLKY